MTIKAQRIALAKLDGRWPVGTVELPTHPLEQVEESLPDYLDSYNAIIPLVNKCWRRGLINFDVWNKAWDVLCGKPYMAIEVLTATPEQISKVLLMSTSCWKD